MNRARARLSTVGFGICAGLTFLLRAPSLIRPIMDVDEGSYAAIACRMLGGAQPYRDVVENKPPGIYYLYEAVFALFGRYNMVALHVLTALAALATALTIGAIARDVAARHGDDDDGERARFLGALAYTIFSTTYYPKMLAANTEMFLVLPASLALLVYLRARARIVPLLTAGLMAATALLFKQVAAFVIAVLIADIARRCVRTRAIRPALRSALFVVAGFVVPLAALAIWFRRLGILDDAAFWSWTYNFRYYLPAGNANQGFALNLVLYLCPFLLTVSPLVCLALRARPLDRYALFWIWLAAGSSAALVGGRMYGHYFLMMLPPLCVLAAVGGASLFRTEATPSRTLRFVVLATPLIAIGSLVAAIIYEPATESLWSPSPSYLVAANYVKATTAPDDRIFVWGWFPPLYVESDRCPSTRFVTMHVLAGPAEGTRGHNVPRGWDMLLDDLRRAPPRLILDTATGDYGFSYAALQRYPRLWTFIESRYDLETTLAGVRIFRLRR